MKAAARLPALTNFFTLAVFVSTSSAHACRRLPSPRRRPHEAC